MELAQDIAENAGTTSPKMRVAVLVINNYRRYIRNANSGFVVKLQKALIDSLLEVSFNSECYQRKMATFEFVKDGCKKGRGSFDDLYERAMIDFRTNEDLCKDESGLPYTTKDELRKFVNVKAKEEQFEINCLLNGDVKRLVVCEQVNLGFSVSQIIKNVNANPLLVETIAEACPARGLTPLQMKTICEVKPYTTLKEIVQQFPATKEKVIADIFNTCPHI